MEREGPYPVADATASSLAVPKAGEGTFLPFELWEEHIMPDCAPVARISVSWTCSRLRKYQENSWYDLVPLELALRAAAEGNETLLVRRAASSCPSALRIEPLALL